MSICARESKLNKFELDCAESELNKLHAKLESLLTTDDSESDPATRLLKLEIKRCESSVEKQRDLEAKNLIYLSRAKWAEEGEKSSKYFLNLMRSKSADSTIHSVKTDSDDEVTDQKSIENEIYRYYSQLYSCKTTDNSTILNDLFLSHGVSISSQQKSHMDAPLTLLDLFKSLQSCDDSAPGPDAIPYSVYKKFWHLLGPPLLASWKYSIETGRMSQDQRQSIITLIPKKDKDKSILSNLRPISLTNTDVKIITKAITLKLNPILETIISPTQTAYVPGRQVTDNNFLLDKIIQLANKTKENLFILSLDAKKAFDSVDHEYMYSTLKSFGFGDEFIATIRTIYKDLTASILVNGFKTQVLKLLSGVKQGDALSCALFVICVEPLFRAIQKSQNIKGFNVRSPFTLERNECKLAGYADDLTPIVSNVESIEETFKLYYKFSQRSGVYLNPDKTEILKAGPHYVDPISEIIVSYGPKIYKITTSKNMKICGVVHPTLDEASYKQNITDKIMKLKQLLNSWRSRCLSLIGKILITKVFGLSQLIYFLQSCHIENSDLKNIETILFSFIWSSKSERPNDKIKRKVMKCSVLDGGLGAPDIFSLNKTLKFRKWLRTNHNSAHPVSIIQDRLLFDAGVKDKFPQELHKSVISNIPCKFYQLALETNNHLTNINFNHMYLSYHQDSVDSDQLTFVAAHPLSSSIYLHNNPNKHQILRRTSILGIANLGSLVTFHSDNPQSSAWLQVTQCLRAFPRLWITLLTERNDWKLNSYPNEMINIGDSTWIKNQHVTTKQIRTLLLKQSATPVDRIDVIQKHSLQIGDNEYDAVPENPFNIKIFHSPYLQTLHYRILHKAVTTRAKLFLYNKLESPECPFCEDHDDVLAHALYECELSRHTWSNFQSWLNKYNIPFQMQVSNVVLGIKESAPFGSLLNTITMLIKRILISPSETRRSLSLQEIENIVKDQLSVERSQIGISAKGRRNLRNLKLNKRWRHLLRELS